MARVMSTYEEVKAERGVMDFEDVLLVLLGILRERDDIARTIRGQYRHFVVDEFQDVSPLQHALLLEWLGERTDLCVVGDPAQTIYSLRRRERGLPHRFHVPISGGRGRASRAQLPLDAPGRESGQCPAHRAGGRAAAVAWSWSLSARPGQRRPAPPTRTTRPRRGPWLQPCGPGLDGGGSASSIAVLFRTNGQSEALGRRSPSRTSPTSCGRGRFFQRREVREAIVLLRGATRSDDGSVPLPELVRDVIIGAGWSHLAPTTVVPPARSGSR